MKTKFNDNNRIPTHLMITLLISLYAILLILFKYDVTSMVACFAMFVSSLGDIILMDYKPILKHTPFKGFICGAVVFAISHIIYIIAVYLKIRKIPDAEYVNKGFLVAISIYILILVATVILTLTRKDGNKILLLPCLAYLLIISLNMATVFSYTYISGGMAYISAIGIVSFLISDLFIVIDKILNVKSKTLQYLIWWFYPIGQILLLTGV